VPPRPFRIVGEAAVVPLATPPPLSLDDDAALVRLDPHAVAVREVLRPAGPPPSGRHLEVFSRAWFEELEIKRYSPHGEWLRRVLEFSRHPHDNLLMMGPGAGSDAIQYQRHGTTVTICATPDDSPALIRRNFDSRGLTVRLDRVRPDGSLPYEPGRFDLAYLNWLYDPPADPAARVAEVYRVLKPGGKVFTLLPAYYDVGFWQRRLTPWRHWLRGDGSLGPAPHYSARAARRLFGDFSAPQTCQRHLRRGELPYLWRSTPVGLMARLMGRVLVLKAFKPIAAALPDATALPRAA
jgi:SAM-dependent methyltransferase